MAAPKHLNLNLLLRQDNRPKFLVNLLSWILSSGRFLVVVVEIIVIAAFLLRYKFDADIAATQDEIRKILPYIQSKSQDEAFIKQTQFQISSTKTVKSTNLDFAAVIGKIAQATPQTIKLGTVNLDRTQTFPQTNLTIIGTAPSNIELNAYIQALQKDPQFSAVTLTNISFDKSEVSFNVTAVLNDKLTNLWTSSITYETQEFTFLYLHQASYGQQTG